MPIVQLPICVRSLGQISNAHWEYLFSTSHQLRSRLFPGWPRLECSLNWLVYRLPTSSYCGRGHSPMIGARDSEDFLPSTSCALGPKFWDLLINNDSLEARSNFLRCGGQTDLAPLTAVGTDPLLSVSLASSIRSLRPAYEAWKAGNLKTSMLSDVPGTYNNGMFFSVSQAFSLWSSPRSSLCSLWKVTSVPGSSDLLQRPSTRMKRPLVHLRPREMFIRGAWRFVRVAERQVCRVHSVPLFNNISSLVL